MRINILHANSVPYGCHLWRQPSRRWNASKSVFSNVQWQQIFNTYRRQSIIDKNYLRTLIIQHSNLLHFVAVYLHRLHRPLSGMHWMRTSQNQKPAAFVAPMRAEAERVTLLKSKSKLKTTSETKYIWYLTALTNSALSNLSEVHSSTST
jgi:hypothetical protein